MIMIKGLVFWSILNICNLAKSVMMRKKDMNDSEL